MMLTASYFEHCCKTTQLNKINVRVGSHHYVYLIAIKILILQCFCSNTLHKNIYFRYLWLLSIKCNSYITLINKIKHENIETLQFFLVKLKAKPNLLRKVNSKHGHKHPLWDGIVGIVMGLL